MKKKTALLAVIGVLLGIPLSYYFQPGVVRAKMGISEYVTQLPQIMGEGADFVIPVVLSVVLFGFGLGVIGHFLDRQSPTTATSEAPEEPQKSSETNV